jgi:hypothetical protein
MDSISRKAVMSSLEEVVFILKNLLNEIPPEMVELQRLEGAWTITEHMAHLAEIQPVMLHRLELFKKEKNPLIKPFNPVNSDLTDWKARPIEKIFESYQVNRKKQISFISEESDEYFQRQANHPEYSSYSPDILLRHMLMHDHWHMYRMEDLWLAREGFVSELKFGS